MGINGIRSEYIVLVILRWRLQHWNVVVVCRLTMQQRKAATSIGVDRAEGDADEVVGVCYLPTTIP